MRRWVVGVVLVLSALEGCASGNAGAPVDAASAGDAASEATGSALDDAVSDDPDLLAGDDLAGGDDVVTGSGVLLLDPGLVVFGGRKVLEPAAIPVTIRSTGDRSVRVTGIEFESNPSARFSLDVSALPSPPSVESPLVLEPGASATFDVIYEPDAPSEAADDKVVLDLAAIVVRADVASGGVTMHVSGFGLGNVPSEPTECPTAVGAIEEGAFATPGTVLHLDGTSSFVDGGSIAWWEWRAFPPAGTASSFAPSSSASSVTFEAAAEGKYRFSLDVWDNLNRRSCSPWEGEVVVVKDGVGIRVELTWSTAGDPNPEDEGQGKGADLDLHFVNEKNVSGGGYDGDGDGAMDPWYDQPYDCFWFNPNPDWASFDPEVPDNPKMVRDDLDGLGPEVLELPLPEEDASYRVGVHYWSDFGFGPSLATLKVFIFDDLVLERKDVPLKTSDFWWVGRVDWKTKTFEPEGGDGGDRITPGYVHPMFIPPPLQ